jgi:DNA-binding IclR family transcriptional regulator
MQIENNTVSRSQTLDRGLTLLELVAASDYPQSTDALAAALGLHRSVVYRLVRTLEDRRLVERDAAGHFLPGIGLAALARSVRSPLRTAAVPVLGSLADELRMTAFLVLRDDDEAVTIESVEPRGSDVHVVYRPGNRHDVGRGAPGLALLAGTRAIVGERPEITQCRNAGWVATAAEVLPGMSSVASPIDATSAIAVVFPVGQRSDVELIGRRVAAGAQQIRERMHPS